MSKPIEITHLTILIEEKISNLQAILEGQEENSSYALAIHNKINAFREVLQMIDSFN